MPRKTSLASTALLLGPTLLIILTLVAGGLYILFLPGGVRNPIPVELKPLAPGPIRMPGLISVRGRIVDARGAPIAGAEVVKLCRSVVIPPSSLPLAVSDTDGHFHFDDKQVVTVFEDETERLQVRLRGGREYEIALVPLDSGEVLLKIPTLRDPAIRGPEGIAADELAGVAVGADGRPLEGVEVEVLGWRPRKFVHTDQEGHYRLPALGKVRTAAVRLSKPGYEPRLVSEQTAGEQDYVVVMDNRTSFKGRVLAPDGSPVPGALVRGDSGPRSLPGWRMSECWTEAKSGAGGDYRLYIEQGIYDVQVRMPGVGMARLRNRAIASEQTVALDIRLGPGLEFVARAVDAETGKPIAGVKLATWNEPGLSGTSDASGLIRVRDMMPGPLSFGKVEAKGYARWWSDACLKEWNRLSKNSGRNGFQRNFDDLDFDVQPGMEPVKIELERGVTVRGQVVDPEGKPVAGATAAPALTGTGNSLTGDTRFSELTDADGRFEMHLPASGDVQYNLVAHDGKYSEWRTWANGTLTPIRTTPGQVIEGVVLRLSRPGTVTGRVVDAEGKAVADREVQAVPASRDENRYYNPTTRTGSDGSFTLEFVRPANLIQAAPFWLDAAQAPRGSSQTVTVGAGQTASGVALKASPTQ